MGCLVSWRISRSIQTCFKGQIKLKRVEISKPWIRIFNFDCDISLSEAMKQLGLTLPFDGAARYLTGMVEGTFTDERPYVGEVLLKCRIESNEKGTKAVAFIGYAMCYGASPPDLNPTPSTDFVVDHPFMFMIREDCSETILFVGASVIIPYLSEPTQQLGLTLPFHRMVCDHTGMVEDTLSSADRPYVGEVLQKCRVETNEKGTEAVAFTMDGKSSGCAAPS
ncbi:hypothetical protein Cgig2_016646 [Carnegiea gigantea]|uniref:Serpin domain-containing protein n=1 Tax=Carnegiea gigantea TaxID=171969 RepID=A0A9Q1KZT0_9CARY|nr:hypothetical protein Cgig2_016646 [Carnegiea gigantea]